MRVKKAFISLVIMFLTTGGLVAQTTNYSKSEIRQKARSVPEEISDDVDRLSEYLTKGLTAEEAKAYAFYYYTANAIEYNFEKSDRITINASREDILEDALTEGVGVCQHYSELFHALSKTAKIKSYVVAGYTRQNGKVRSTAHSWNALLIDDKWKLFDPTWGGGYRQGNDYVHRFTEEYFLVTPEKMIKSHMPYDPIFQFSNKVITHKDFKKGKFAGHIEMFDDYRQALIRHSDLPEQTQLKEAMNRIQRVWTGQETVEKYYNFLKQNYNVHLANEQVNLHNKAANILNEGVDIFNRYVNRLNENRGNYPGGRQAAINELEKAEQKVKKAKAIFNSVNPPMRLRNSVSKNKNIAIQLLKRIDKEKSRLPQ